MKKLYTSLVIILLSLYSLAQSPQSFNYQAVLRDAAGTIQANQSVAVIISILQELGLFFKFGIVVQIQLITITT